MLNCKSIHTQYLFILVCQTIRLDELLFYVCFVYILAFFGMDVRTTKLQLFYFSPNSHDMLTYFQSRGPFQYALYWSQPWRTYLRICWKKSGNHVASQTFKAKSLFDIKIFKLMSQRVILHDLKTLLHRAISILSLGFITFLQ